VTKKYLEDTLNCITETIPSAPLQSSNGTSYGDAAHQGTFNNEPTRKTPSPEVQEKQVTLSMPKVDRMAKVMSLSLSELTALCNKTLAEFFTRPKNGAINMDTPLRGTSPSQTGNITLTFRSKEDATRAKIHEDWVRSIDD
jgi:hypothetical protein